MSEPHAKQTSPPMFQKDYEKPFCAVACPHAELHRIASFTEPFDWEIHESKETTQPKSWVECNHCIWDDTPDIEMHLETTPSYTHVMSCWKACSHEHLENKFFVCCPTCRLLYVKGRSTSEERVGSDLYVECATQNVIQLMKEGLLS